LINSLEVKITELELSSSSLDEKNHELQNQINALQEQRVSYEDDLESYEEKISSLNVEKNKLQLEIIENKKSISLFSQDIEDMNIKLENVLADKEELKLDLSEKESQLSQRQTIIDDLITEKSEAFARIQSLNVEVIDMQKQYDELNMEKADIVDQNKQLQDELLGLEIDLQEFQDNFEKMNQEKKAEADRLNQVIKSQMDDKELYFVEKQELNKTINTLENQSRDLSLKMIHAAEKFEVVFSQKQNLESQIDENKELHVLVQKRNQELDTVFANLLKREEQLSLYSRWVDSQKEGLQKQVLKIAAELRATKEFNPLNPYLIMTEKEISKIEVLLTKSNVFGPQRAQLENQYEQLIKQRDEVRELLVRTNNEVDRKAQTLISTLKSSEFIPVPPLPPGEVDKGETDLQLS
jgi:chromosome segregation ATPase